MESTLEKRLTYDLDYSDLTIDKTIIEKLMGFTPGSTDDIFLSVINSIDREIGKFLEIKAEIRLFENFEWSENKKNMLMEEHNFSPGRIIINQMDGTEIIALGICTAGKGVSDLMKKAMDEGDTFKAYTIDLFGSEIVEAAMDMVQNDLKIRMESKGLQITNRYSPGYCNWDVSEQHNFFKLFPHNYPGISLTGSALMTPVKSVSCMIGIGENVKFNNYTCGICGMKNCIYRERKLTD